MRDLREASSQTAEFPRVVFVHQSSLAQGEDFFAETWPGVDQLADPDLQIFAAFGLRPMGLGEFLRRSSFAQLLRAFRKGHFVGRPQGGRILQEPGAFLIEAQKIVWHHPFQKGIGDSPNWAEQPWLATTATLD